MTIIFLSPHYDDAVYSCGGTIYDLTQSGHEVIIWTLMAGIPQPLLPDTPVLRDNHTRWQVGDNPVAIRREEDRRAATIVGADTRYSDLLDCIYRTDDDVALYPTEDSLWTTVHVDDPAVPYLSQLQLTTFDQIYAPLGVGQHVDHLIVRDMAWQLAQQDATAVQFYVEYPYLRDRKQVDHALSIHPARLKLVQRQISEDAIQHKIEAMTAYRSQISSFWDDEASIATEVRHTFTYNNQFVEEFAHAK